ncbi:hypothetical protein [Phormidium nigroviride]
MVEAHTELGKTLAIQQKVLVEQERNRAIGITSLTMLSGVAVGNSTPIGSLGGAFIALAICLSCFLKLQKTEPKSSKLPPPSTELIIGATDVFIGTDGLAISQQQEKT